MHTVIWWIRRDLRLADNSALAAAAANSMQVIPCFVIDPRLMNITGTAEKRQAFLLGGLVALDAELRRRGSYLVVRRGDPLNELRRLIAESGAQAIYAEPDFSPYARQRDARVAEHLPLHLVGGPSLRHPDQVRRDDGTPYTVFTSFKKAWLTQPLPHPSDLLPPPDHLTTPMGVASRPLPPFNPPPDFPPGEAEAIRRLDRFLAGPIADYADRRNRIDLDGTSRLSPYLRFGMLSARQMVVAARQALEGGAGKGAEVWLDELIWREFYISILWYFPHVLKGPFRPEYADIAWRNAPDDFAAWQNGRTGYPVVDAAMRQLLTAGWMHNRGRMIVASFLVKDLLIDWRWGERWFMQHLVDGDPAANNGGWQWTAGVGTDAAPYFRVFNPVLQSQKFDPRGNFIRRWLPELRNVPDDYIHQPWKMPPEVQRRAGCHIGRDYPAPIVEHAFGRQRTLEAFKRAKAEGL